MLKCRPIVTGFAGEEAFEKKIKRDVTIMTSSGHATSSGPCAIDSPYASSYSLYVETTPLSGLFSEIFDYT